MLQNAVLRNAVPRNAVLQSVVIPNVALRSAVFHAVALIVVPILALSAVRDEAVIQALIPAHDVQNAAVPSPAVVRCVARACWQEHSRWFPVVVHVFPIRPRGRGRGLGVAEAQAVL